MSFSHADRDSVKENKRQKGLKEHLKCTFVRINPDKKDFIAYDGLGEIYRFFEELKKREIKNLEKENEKLRKDNEELGKENKELKKDIESLIDDLSKRLLELEFKSNHSIKSNCLKWIVKKTLPNYKKMKKSQSKIKSIKTGKKFQTTCCLGCKDFTHYFRPQEVKQKQEYYNKK